MFQWCVYDGALNVHVHLYGVYADSSCCAAGQCAARGDECGPRQSNCDSSAPTCVVARERFAVSFTLQAGLPLMTLPADVLRHVLVPYVGALGRYALRSTCRALRRIIPVQERDCGWRRDVWVKERKNAWRRDMWMEACATGNLETLAWLHARVALPTTYIEAMLVCLAAALRDQVSMLRWLARHGLYMPRFCVPQVDSLLAGGGCLGALKYLLGSCDQMRQRMNEHELKLAHVAAYYGRLDVLHWLHASGVERLDEGALMRASGRHEACVAYLQSVLQK